MKQKSTGATGVLVIAFLIFGFFTIQTPGQTKSPAKEREVTVLVTAIANNARTKAIAAKLQPVDFVVSEDGIPQKILSVKKAGGAPVQVAVLIQDNLVSRVNNELNEIKTFVRGLPEGSKVMTAYVSGGALSVRQEFTTDRESAAKSLRIISGSEIGAPYSPFIQLSDALKRFDDGFDGRKIVLFVSDGLDGIVDPRDASPFFSLYLDNAVRNAQNSGINIYPIYAPSAGRIRFSRRAINNGQGSLLRLADETGGEAFFSGSDFVTFSPYFKELNQILENQWLIKYVSNSEKSGFRKIKVVTDFDIHLQYPAGYRSG